MMTCTSVKVLYLLFTDISCVMDMEDGSFGTIV